MSLASVIFVYRQDLYYAKYCSIQPVSLKLTINNRTARRPQISTKSIDPTAFLLLELFQKWYKYH